MYLGLCIHVGPLVDEDFSHIHSVFLSSQMEWGEATLQEIPGMSVMMSVYMWLSLRFGM